MAGQRHDYAEIRGPLADPAQAVAAVRRAAELAIRARTQDVLEAAEARWPVATGKSKAALYIEIREEGSVIVGRVGNGARYARYIQSGKLGSKSRATARRPVFTEEIAKPMRQAQKALVADIREMVGQALASVVG